MLTKKTSKNQLTLPKEIVKEFPDIRYFEAVVAKESHPSQNETGGCQPDAYQSQNGKVGNYPRRCDRGR